MSTTVVVRAGLTLTINTDDLLVGDIVMIESGKAIPADCVLINSSYLTCNESALTGESEIMHKSHVTSDNY